MAATSQMAVSSTLLTYPPMMGICSIMMVSPERCHPAIMFMNEVLTLSSFICEHSWQSQLRRPLFTMLADMRPTADSGVSGP